MSKKLTNFFTKCPGLFLLLIILSLITVASLKPQFYLVGWDNYSSYFNLKSNIFRTFFATWREYRGLGAPSDSESTDLFRQIFYLILKPFVPETLLDQLYILTALNIGVLSMYFLCKRIFSSIQEKLSERVLDLLSFTGAFFYLFNLNTLSTFYFPMIMYINRFWSLPLLILIFHELFHKNKTSNRFFSLVVLAFLFASGSYVTATVFITTSLALFLFSLFQGNLKRGITLLLFYFSLNIFWLLPFANYTLQKSPIIRLAPTFIEANEIQLNKPKSFYDLKYQLILYPNFFETKYKDSTLKKVVYFHSLSGKEKQPVYFLIFFIFPFLYILGSILMLIKFRKTKPLLWTPLIIFIFLFLALKEFSPLGFIYTYLDHLTPYFGVLFRFGDTKFHPYIGFAGSISAAYAVLLGIRYISRRIILMAVLLICLSYLFIYKDYLRGKLIGEYMYNKIPSAYFEITDRINKDKADVRVLHLPYDREAYWKMYSWGMLGSSFLNFMLDKPLLEKTFEPASMENAYLNKRLDQLIYNTQSLDSQEQRRTRADSLYTLLKKTGVKYIILDGSVQAQIYPRGITLWGKFNGQDSKSAVSNLISFGYAKTAGNYLVDLNEYKNTYKLWDKRSEEEKKLLNDNGKVSIQLVELNEYAPKISFFNHLISLDPGLKNGLETDLSTRQENFIRDQKADQFILFPFKRSDAKINLSDNEIKLSLPRQSKSAFVNIKVPRNTDRGEETITNQIALFVSKTASEVIFKLYLDKTPIIDGQQIRTFLKEIRISSDDPKLKNAQQSTLDSSALLSDWSSSNKMQYGNLRLRVGEVTVPVPLDLTAGEQFIGSVLARGGSIPIDLLAYSEKKPIDPKTLSPTENPNCFEDSLQDFEYKIDNTSSNFHITGQNGSTCFFTDLNPILGKKTDYGELEMDINGTSTDLDDFYLHSMTENSKPRLRNAIIQSPKLNLLRACIKEYNVDDCYNKHYFIDLKSEPQRVIIPTDKSISGIQNLLVFFSLKNNLYQRQEATIKEMSLNLFESIRHEVVNFDPNTNLNSRMTLNNDKDLSIHISKPISAYSYYFQKGRDGLYISNKPCSIDKLYRTFRRVGERLVVFSEKCDNEIFQTNPFSSGNFYLWGVSYNLMSGKFPVFILEDGFYRYKYEFFSLNQGYPDIAGFKIFQEPELFYSRLTTDDIIKKIQNARPETTYTYLYPQPEIKDRRPKDFVVHQDSENEAVMTFDSYDIVELPTQWEDFSIETPESAENYDIPEHYSFKRILPSLWKVEIPAGTSGNYLLNFNEAFDKQWVGYTSLWGVFFNLGRSYKPLDCNTFANCYRVEKTNKDKPQTIYLSYTPERLNLLGWVLTFLAIEFFLRLLVKRNLVSS
ncbi:hypothetical protein HY612_03025 [Candidatus Roizmanbacteria bacterium]|nr:hypothetical protein [Candidatus Roizmanbacteria bacterium]